MTPPGHPEIDLEQEVIKNHHTPKKRAEVATYLDEISHTLQKGYSQKAVYEALHKRELIHCSYEYFNRTLRELLASCPQR